MYFDALIVRMKPHQLTSRIRLDSSLIVLYGERLEADDAELTGSVVLMHHESMMIKSVKVILEGARKLSYGLTARCQSACRTSTNCS